MLKTFAYPHFGCFRRTISADFTPRKLFIVMMIKLVKHITESLTRLFLSYVRKFV